MVPGGTARWPLTGLARHRPAPQHPVYVVKIDNTADARPQVGLDKADLIVEEPIADGQTRLAAFFYSTLPRVVGPVRSTGTADIGLARPANAFVVASEADSHAKKLMNRAHVKRVLDGARGFYRSNVRDAPENLMMRLPSLSESVGRPWSPPATLYLPFGPASTFHGTRPVSSVQIGFGPGHTEAWDLAGDVWALSDPMSQPGRDFRSDNLLILREDTGTSGFPMTKNHLIGSGQAVLVHGGRAIDAIWHKASAQDAITLTADGKRLTVPTGKTFIALVPTTGGQVSINP